MNRHRTYLLVTGTAFIVSAIISLLFYWGRIDSDFFAFLYVGQGILDGNDMYRDFADNKGPVLYLFFAFLRLIFGNHYAAMLFVGSAILDAATIVLVFAIIKRVWGVAIPMTRAPIIIAFATLSVAWYKSFFLGYFPGGIYSESIAIPLLLGSVLMVSNNKPLKGGILFSLSVLTRLSMIFFLFCLIALLIQYRKKWR